MSENSFESIVKAKVANIKAELAQVESIGHFEFSITAEGCVDGEVVVAFHLGKYSSEVRGDSVQAVLNEFLRRHGWNERHAPLCLPNVRQAHEEQHDEPRLPFSEEEMLF